MAPRRDVSMTPQEVHELLGEAPTAVLSTLGPRGYPHLAAMWFVPALEDPRPALRMWTYRASQKSKNLHRDPRCGLLVERGVEYNELKGVLVRGAVELVEEPERIELIGRQLYERYVSKRTGRSLDDESAADIRRQAGKRVGLVLPLDDVASWDHSKL